MTSQDEDILVRLDRNRTVEFAVRTDGTKPGRVFFDSLPKEVRERLLSIFHHVAERDGIGVSPLMFKHERDEIWTFKCKLNKRRIRMPCFRFKNRWIITHGFIKPSKANWPEQEFTLAFDIMREVIARYTKK